VQWLRWLVAGVSPRRPGFTSWSVHVGFVVDKVAPSRVLRFSPVNIIPPWLSTLIYHLEDKQHPAGGSSSGTVSPLRHEEVCCKYRKSSKTEARNYPCFKQFLKNTWLWYEVAFPLLYFENAVLMFQCSLWKARHIALYVSVHMYVHSFDATYRKVRGEKKPIRSSYSWTIFVQHQRITWNISPQRFMNHFDNPSIQLYGEEISCSGVSFAPCTELLYSHVEVGQGERSTCPVLSWYSDNIQETACN
jgi:hypothetical protein